jgi:hypothetical protein
MPLSEGGQIRKSDLLAPFGGSFPGSGSARHHVDPIDRACPASRPAKEQLKELVAEMGEEQASRALGLLEPLLGKRAERGQARRLPAFVGSEDSG